MGFGVIGTFMAVAAVGVAAGFCARVARSRGRSPVAWPLLCVLTSAVGWAVGVLGLSWIMSSQADNAHMAVLFNPAVTTIIMIQATVLPVP